jgi:hypothetical protein
MVRGHRVGVVRFYVTRYGDNLFADCVLALDARTGTTALRGQRRVDPDTRLADLVTVSATALG